MDVKLVNPNFESNYVENLLRARGVNSIEDYMDPQPYELQNPKDLKNIGIGAALYNRIVLNDKPPYSRILLIVDSDVDGFSSAAIFYLFTKQVNCHCQIDYWLHSGKQHGLQDHIERLMSENIEYDLIVCPDSSSNDATYHDMLSEIKIPCLVLDHHLTDVKLSDNAVVINNQISPNYHNKELVGAGVTFQFCRYIDSLLGSHFVDNLIDLAALGQIGDMGSVLTLENRYIIKEGLSHIQNKMFRAILEKQSYSITGTMNASWEEIIEKTNPISVAFYVVPLVNAVIRVGTMEEKELLFKAFLDGDEMVPCNKRGAKGTLERACVEATRIATNARAHQNKFLDAAVEKLEARIFKYDLLENKILCVVLDDTDTFPSELNGLLAMRLSAKYHHPTMVVRENDEGYLRGSMRGLNNNKFSNFKDYLQSTGLFEYVMGHQGAAGCSLPARSLETFFECSNYDLKDYDFNESEYLVNFMRDASDLDIIDIINDISNAGGIWGQGSPEPLIYIKNIPLSNIKIMGSNKDTLKIEYNGIAYMKFHTKDLIEEISNGNKIDIVGRANLNEWNGMVTPQIFIDAYEVKNERDLGF